MKILTKHTDYAIRALVHLAGAQGFVSAGSIARAERIPAALLRRILGVLIKQGILHAREGAGGGVRFAVEPACVSAADIIRVFQGAISVSACLYRSRPCSHRASCALRVRLKGIERVLGDQLASFSIQDLVNESKGARP